MNSRHESAVGSLLKYVDYSNNVLPILAASSSEFNAHNAERSSRLSLRMTPPAGSFTSR